MAVLGYVLVILGIFFGDMRIKNRIEKDGALPKSLFGGRILIRRHHNKGAMLNMGQSRRVLVAALSVALSLLMTVVFLASLGRRGNALLRAGLAFLLGGAFSNTYDRLKRRYVVDYFSFRTRWRGFGNIVFNISDFCIIIGALLAVLGA